MLFSCFLNPSIKMDLPPSAEVVILPSFLSHLFFFWIFVSPEGRHRGCLMIHGMWFVIRQNRPSFRYVVSLLIQPSSSFLAVFWTAQESKGFASTRVETLLKLGEACFWRFVWAFNNLPFYLGSREEIRRHYYCVDIAVDIISADSSLLVLPNPLLQDIFMDNEWAPTVLKTQLWLQ